MKLSEIKKQLNTLENVTFHYQTALMFQNIFTLLKWFNYKNFIDCGGK
jgi:hypothetical protein